MLGPVKHHHEYHGLFGRARRRYEGLLDRLLPAPKPVLAIAAGVLIVTGALATSLGAELSQKRLELARELFPKATAVSLLVNPSNPNTEAIVRDVEAAARSFGLQLHVLRASTPRGCEAREHQQAQGHQDQRNRNEPGMQHDAPSPPDCSQSLAGERNI